MIVDNGDRPRGKSTAHTGRTLEMEDRMDKEFEEVIRSSTSIADFLWEEPRLAWEGGWIPIIGSVLATFHVSRKVLWPRYFAGWFGKNNKIPPTSPFRNASTQSPMRGVPSIPQMIFELGMGFSVGSYVNHLTSDMSRAEQITVKIPLKAGKSPLSDKLCPHLLEEYRRQWNQGSTKQDVLRSPTHHDLQVTLRLVRHCRYRQLMQQREKRSSSGSSIPEAIVVRSNGQDPLVEMMNPTNEQTNRSESGYSHEASTNWVGDSQDYS